MSEADSTSAVPGETLSRVIAALREAADPERIILFGSHARGEAAAESDLDLLVVERGRPDVVREMVRLRRALSFLDVTVDLLVATETDFDYWSETPGHLYFEIATEGKVLYEKAA